MKNYTIITLKVLIILNMICQKFLKLIKEIFAYIIFKILLNLKSRKNFKVIYIYISQKLEKSKSNVIQESIHYNTCEN